MSVAESGIKVALLLLVNEIEIFRKRLRMRAMYYGELHNISAWPTTQP